MWSIPSSNMQQACLSSCGCSLPLPSLNVPVGLQPSGLISFIYCRVFIGPTQSQLHCWQRSGVFPLLNQQIIGCNEVIEAIRIYCSVKKGFSGFRHIPLQHQSLVFCVKKKKQVRLNTLRQGGFPRYFHKSLEDSSH